MSAGVRQPFLDFGGMAVLLAVLYNAILSIINAHFFTLNASIVVASEILIVVPCLAYIALRIRELPNLFPPLLFFLVAFLGFIIVSIANETLYVKAVRDVLLIVTFFLMGGLITEKSLITAFKILGWLVLIFMVVENYATEIYAALFKPAFYYANTRGLEEYDYNKLGIFNAALGYETRFSYNVSHHRLSSIFLEQVSLGNFAILLSIFLVTFWERLKKFDRTFFCILILLTILTTDSRAGTGICVIVLLGFFLFPHLPRYTNLLYVPIILTLSYLFFYDPYTIDYKFSDDLPGRIGNTLFFLNGMDMSYLTGGSLEQINTTWDSGYAYTIYALTIFGFLALYLFATLVIRQEKPDEKRFVHSANLFLFITLMVSGAVFSIKVAALLWTMAGFVYYKRFAKA